MNLFSFFTFYAAFTQTVGALAAILTIYISYTLTRKKAEDCYWIMAMSAVCELVPCLITGVALMYVKNHDGVQYIFLINSLIPHPTFRTAQHACGLYIFGLMLCAPNVATHFWYRYNLLCKNVKWSKAKYLARFGVFFAWLTVHNLVLAFVPIDDYEAYANVTHTFIEFEGFTPPKFCYFSANNWKTVAISSDCFLINVVAYAMIAYCGTKIVAEVKKLKGARSSTVKLQEQIIKIIIFQAVTPLVALFLPLAIVCVCIVLKIQIVFLDIFVELCVLLMPVLNTTCILIMFPPYRKTLLGLSVSSYAAGPSSTSRVGIPNTSFNLT